MKIILFFIFNFFFSSIENNNGNLFLIPENHDFETYLNGELVYKREQIFDGDRLVIGGTHYFRVSNPYCVKRNKNIENTRVSTCI